MSDRLRGSQKTRELVWETALITMSRVTWLARFVATATLLLCGCATRPLVAVSSPDAGFGGPSGPHYATVESVRPIPGTGAAAASSTQILTAMGVAPGGGAAAEEVVLQTDDGQTLSVVEPAGALLAAGARVRVLPGSQPRLVPVSATPST